MPGGSKTYISASELADFVYCERSWKFGAEGYSQDASAEALEQGTRWHERHGRRFFLSRRLVWAGRLVFLVGVLALAVVGFLMWLGWGG